MNSNKKVLWCVVEREVVNYLDEVTDNNSLMEYLNNISIYPSRDFAKSELRALGLSNKHLVPELMVAKLTISIREA